MRTQMRRRRKYGKTIAKGVFMTLTGSVYNIIYRNEQNGYTVFELGNDSELTTVCGCFASLSEGEHIQVEGQWKQRPKTPVNQLPKSFMQEKKRSCIPC